MARAKKLTLSLHKTRLVFTFRKFKTQKANRSKRVSQLVLPLKGLPYKELAIAKSRPGRKHAKPGLKAWPYLAMVAVSLLGIGYFSLQLKKAPEIKLVASQQHVQQPIARRPATHLARSVPTRISVPAIDLDATLAQVGLDASGKLQVPTDPYMAGWYTGSPTPGEIGPAVIDGHVDRVGGIAIFWRLREIKPGDTIQIQRQDGSTASFKVDALEQFAQDNFPTQKVYGNISHAGLRLITCGGIFNPATGHYSDNIVVFATLI